MNPRRLPSLSALRAFEAAARHESAKQAAQELSVTATAISHQIRGLEEALGVELFVRKPRQLLLTPKGRDLQEVPLWQDSWHYLIFNQLGGSGVDSASLFR